MNTSRSLSLHPTLAWFLAVAAVANTVFGIWVAFLYEGVDPVLIPFALVSGVGAVLSVIGAIRNRVRLLGVGLLLQAAAPTGFAAWLSFILAIIGVVIVVLTLTRVRKRSSSGSRHVLPLPRT